MAARLKWADPGAADQVIARLDDLLSLNADGSVGLGWDQESDTAIEMLADLVAFPSDVPARRKRALTQRAVIDSVKTRSLSPNVVINKLQAGTNSYRKLPPRPFILMSTISMRHLHPLSTIRIRNSTLTFSARPPSRFVLPARATRGHVHHGDRPRDYASVRVHVREREETAAVDLALDRLDLWRSIWNFFLNSGRWRVSSHQDKPLNALVLGPIHTLHLPDGKPATDTIWWEPSYVEPLQPAKLDSNLDELRKFERTVRERLRRSYLRAALERLLIRYVRALDESDKNAAFLKLWGVLEELTNTGKASYSVTVRRAAFLWPEPLFRRRLLEHLRELRNRMVHQGHSPDDGERMAQQLKVHVEALLRFLLQRPRLFKSMDEVGHFLDLPPDRSAIARRIRHYMEADNILRT